MIRFGNSNLIHGTVNPQAPDGGALRIRKSTAHSVKNLASPASQVEKRCDRRAGKRIA